MDRPAGGQRHAGQRVAAHGRGEQRFAEAVIGHDAVDVHALAGRHVGDDEVLVRGEPEIALVNGRDLFQAREERAGRRVDDAA
jgi:hypothetical protein